MENIEQLIPAQTIAHRIEEMGRQISSDFQGKDVVVIGILRGCFIFMADPVGHIDLPVTVDFMEVSTYGDGKQSSGIVKIVKDFSSSITGRHVILVEDIIDTGITLNQVFEIISMKRPASITIAALLVKEGKHGVTEPIVYEGFQIPDEFVVGYGLDAAGLYRNLPYVGVIKQG